MALNCPHCRIAFDTDLELEIHNMSLGHHVQMHKMGHVWHTCPNCEFSCSSLSEFSQHASSERHRQQVKMRRAFLDYVREDETQEERLPSRNPPPSRDPPPIRDPPPREYAREWRDYRNQEDRDHRHREYPRKEHHHQRGYRKNWDNRRGGGGWEQERGQQEFWIDRQGGLFPRYPRGELTGERRYGSEERRENEEQREKAETDRETWREPANTAARSADALPNKGPHPKSAPPSVKSSVVIPQASSSRSGTEENSLSPQPYVPTSPLSDSQRKRGRSKNHPPNGNKEKQPVAGMSSSTASSSSKGRKDTPKKKLPCVVITKITPPPPKKNWEKMVSISAATQRQAERQAMARKRRYFLLDPNASSDEAQGAPSSSVASPSAAGRSSATTDTTQITSISRPEPSSSPPTLLPFDFTPPPQRDPMQELNDTLRAVGNLCEYTLAPVKPKTSGMLTPSNPPSIPTVTIKEESETATNEIQIVDGISSRRERELANLALSQGKIKEEMDKLHQEQYKLQAEFEAVDKAIGGLIYTAEVIAAGAELSSSALADIGRKSVDFFKLRNKVQANHAQCYKLSLELKQIEDKQSALMAFQ